MKAAVPLVLQQDFLTCKNLAAGLVAGESTAYQIGAVNVLRVTVEAANGRIRMEATLTDLATQRNREVVRVEAPSPGGFVPALNALAKKLNPEASAFSTNNVQAVQALTTAAESANLQTRVQLLSGAIAADPSFGTAYIVLAESLAQAGQDAGAILAKAAGHLSSFTPLDRARFNLLAARLSHASLAQQEQATSAVLGIAPNDGDALAALGAQRFLLGDAQGGERVLTRAITLNPANANLRRELALGLFETKNFAKAEKEFLGIDNNASILPELATCILLEGDVHRADSVFDRYLALRPANDPLTVFLRGEWLAISGRQREAVALLQHASSTNPQFQSLALSQISIWQLMGGQTTEAKKSAALAAQLDPRSNSIAGVVLLITRGDRDPAQWMAQVNASGLNDQIKQPVLGYGLFLNRHYAEAAEVWQRLEQHAGGADLKARTMLSASLDRAGRLEDARKVLVQPFVPEFGDLYGAVAFDEMNRLLGIRMS